MTASRQTSRSPYLCPDQWTSTNNLFSQRGGRWRVLLSPSRRRGVCVNFLQVGTSLFATSFYLPRLPGWWCPKNLVHLANPGFKTCVWSRRRTWRSAARSRSSGGRPSSPGTLRTLLREGPSLFSAAGAVLEKLSPSNHIQIASCTGWRREEESGILWSLVSQTGSVLSTTLHLDRWQQYKTRREDNTSLVWFAPFFLPISFNLMTCIFFSLIGLQLPGVLERGDRPSVSQLVALAPSDSSPPRPAHNQPRPPPSHPPLWLQHHLRHPTPRPSLATRLWVAGGTFGFNYRLLWIWQKTIKSVFATCFKLFCFSILSLRKSGGGDFLWSAGEKSNVQENFDCN